MIRPSIDARPEPPRPVAETLLSICVSLLAVTFVLWAVEQPVTAAVTVALVAVAARALRHARTGVRAGAIDLADRPTPR